MLRAGLASFLARLASRRAEQRWKLSEKGLGIKKPLREPPGVREKLPNAITHDAMLNQEYAYTRVAKVIEDYDHLGGFSANPRTGRAYDVYDRKQARDLFEELEIMNGYDPKKPIYFISTTNHAGKWTHRMHSEYMKLLGEHLTPLIGKWKDEDVGLILYDCTYTFQMPEKDALAKGRELKQAKILRIKSDGGRKFVRVK